ncbi:MAG: helix-turn-helix transcriptional regulator, partial [Candidatus Hydrothermarchaeales archaeon]
DRKLFDLRILDIALGLVLGVLLSLVLRWKRREKVPMNVLTSDEERVVRSIIDGGGEIGQDELYSLTGFSRPKISRLVAELVERDLIEKTQFKRTFKLKMKKELISD